MRLRDIKHNKGRARRILREVHKAVMRKKHPDNRAAVSARLAHLARGVDYPLARNKPITNRWMVGQR